MTGILPTTIRDPGPEPEPDGDDQTIVITPPGTDGKSNVVVNYPDGSVVIDLGGGSKNSKSVDEAGFDENLADFLDETTLGVTAEDLLLGIDDDEKSRQDWLDERADGIKLLALKIEKPSSSQSGASAGVDNTSRSRNTLLLEACLRFQATSSGELLPTGGPVKVENKLSSETKDGDDLAQLLEDDFNYYLTNVASEYVPDTERMLLWIAAGGTGFKKVYRCPIRRRPVSESVDAADLCVSNAATDLGNADRITFTSTMRQSVMKRMKYLKVYRDVDCGMPSVENKTSVQEEKEAITGVTVSNRPEDIPYTILECYCVLNLDGDEHKDDKGEITGLPRPYKVTIEKTSRTILEIRRNWKEDDKMERRRDVFVKFPFVPGFGFYDIGLFQIAGNPTTAATALLRIMIDSGIFGNFPGGLIAKGMDKQNTTDISVPPGGFAPIDISMIPDGDIKKAVMPLPYKSPDSAIFQIYQEVVKDGSRVAGIPDMAVGEGRQDAPVGTTIAMVEQAIKVTDAVHKRLHTAQSKEFKLLRDLFVENPEDFWRFNERRDPNWDSEKLTKALTDYDLVPRADPNTSSQTQRIMRAQALYQMAKADPALFQIAAVLDYVLRTLGISDSSNFTQPPDKLNAGPPPDPKAIAAQQSAQAATLTAQARMLDAKTKADNTQQENSLRATESANDLKIEQDRLKSEQTIHGQDLAADARSQVSEQQHERLMHSRGLASDHLQQGVGLLADQASQQAEHDHASNLAAMQPEPMP